jgi:hypothetical protein
MPRRSLLADPGEDGPNLLPVKLDKKREKKGEKRMLFISIESLKHTNKMT